MTATRAYHSPARDQAKADTRDRILDAVVRVVLDDGIHAFSVQNVAKKAGVAHRTVYRHFETREDLLEGLAERLEAQSARAGVLSVPDTVDDIVETIARAFAAAEGDRDLNEAYVVISVALRLQTGSRKRRTAAFEKVIRNTFPNLPRAQVREAAALIRSIAGSRGWYLLTVESGLGEEATTRTVQWAVRALVDDLAKRDRAAARANKRSR